MGTESSPTRETPLSYMWLQTSHTALLLLFA